MKKKQIAILLAAVSSGIIPATAVDYFSAAFQSGIPSSITVVGYSDATPDLTCYRNVDNGSKPWTGARVGTHGAAAVCLTQTGKDIAMDNWMILPAVKIDSEMAVVRWEATNVVPDLSESYEVKIKLADSDEYSTIGTYEATDGKWHKQVISLYGYKGSEVQIAFVCNSVNKFMLAIDNVEVGAMTDDSFEVTNHTSYFSDNSTGFHTVEGDVLNVGVPQSFDKIVLVANGEDVDSVGFSDVLLPGWSFSYSFKLPVTIGEKTAYTIYGEESDGNRVKITEGETICSYFHRKILIDKATGTWCTNCPEGDLLVESLQDVYGDDIIPLATHTGDIMVNTAYFSNLGFSAVPTLMANRSAATKSGSSRNFPGYLATEAMTETIFGLNLNAYLADDGKIHVEGSVIGALDKDNSSDNYRLAYTVVRDCSGDDYNYVQLSNLTSVTAERYYLLPASVPAQLSVFHNVVSECQTGFTGIAGSLPASIEAYNPIPVDFSVNMPNNVEEPQKAKIAVYLLDTQTGYVHNADFFDLSETTGVNNIAYYDDSDSMNIRVSENGIGTVSFPDDVSSYRVNVYRADGTLLLSKSGTNSSFATFNIEGENGIVIVNVVTPNANKSKKFVIG
jgi:hypothetical protein